MIIQYSAKNKAKPNQNILLTQSSHPAKWTLKEKYVLNMLTIKRLEIQRRCQFLSTWHRVIRKKSLQLRKSFYQIGLVGNSWWVIDMERSSPTVASTTLRQMVLKGIRKPAEREPGEYVGRPLFLMVSASALALPFLNDSLQWGIVKQKILSLPLLLWPWCLHCNREANKDIFSTQTNITSGRGRS